MYFHYLSLNSCHSARHGKETDLQLHMIRNMTLRRIIYDDGSVEEHCFASVITGLTNIKESGERIAAVNRLTNRITNILPSMPVRTVSSLMPVRCAAHDYKLNTKPFLSQTSTENIDVKCCPSL